MNEPTFKQLFYCIMHHNTLTNGNKRQYSHIVERIFTLSSLYMVCVWPLPSKSIVMPLLLNIAVVYWYMIDE